MRNQRSVFLSAIIGTALSIVTAQQPTAPATAPTPGAPTQPAPRTPVRASRPGEDPQKGTVTLRGYVVAADTGNPLRRAMVNARSQDGRGGGMTTTDAQGRFEIKELPAGRFTVSASKAGYVAMQHGQRRPEQQGTVLEVVDGQTVEKIAFALPRGGVVTGHVSDEFGEPIAGAHVSALRFRYMSGRRRLTPSGSATTDDRGAFRIYGLLPGDYFVSGALRSEGMMGMPVASANVEGYTPTYYPGTPSAADAQRIVVKVAQETSNVSFSLAATRLVRVSGRAVSSSGEPHVQGFVSLQPVDRFAMPMGMGGTMTSADGTFQIPAVVPGTYHLTLRPRGMPGSNDEFGTLKVSVGGDDIDNLLLVTSRGAIARGAITTDDGTPLPARPQQVTVFARSTDPEMMMGGQPTTVKDDWTFEITGLHDQRIITASVAESPDWGLKAIYLNGEDITDSPIEFIPGQTIEGFQVVFSRKRTNLSGAITDDRGNPDTDATVVIFAEDRARWTYASRFVRTARPDQEGRYNVRGMPPQDYFIVAVRDIEQGQSQDPEFLDSLRDLATRVSLGEGETKVQDLKIRRP